MKCFYNYFKTRTRGQKSAPIFEKSSYASSSTTTNEMVISKSSGTSAAVTSSRSLPELYEEKGHQNLRVFTFMELRKATNNFSRLLKIGEGGFGCVYKGKINYKLPVVDNDHDDDHGKSGESTIIVAIKKLNKDGFQGHKQWVAEVQFLGVVQHPNLVKLIGYCAVDGERGIQRLLVYEYMPNKSLEDHLFNRAYPPLSWDSRLNIILGAAQGLAYLHEGLEIQVIYRDFKSSNVLLDDEFQAKLSDFGLAREGPTAGHTHVSTAVVGTYGYAAPDYIETGHLTTKSDVWSFGVVLYEIITGRRSLERNRPKSEQKLLEWVKNYPPDSRKFGMIIDPRLENQYSLTAARKIAKLADSCLVKSAKDRPNMSKVVETLKEIVRVLVVESPPMKYVDDGEDKSNEEEPSKHNGISASAKRRMAHLAKISEHIGGVSTRRFLVMQRANVT